MMEREDSDIDDLREGESLQPYVDRMQAAGVLAAALSHHSGRNALVLAIARGAVPMGLHIANALEAGLDVVPVRKLCAPAHPELAIGAVDGDGVVIHTPGLESLADARWIQEEIERQRTLLARRLALYRTKRPAISPTSRVVIVVDDGLATGATMRAALGWVRRRSPAWLACAVPVAETESLAALADLADEIICPKRTRALLAISQHYLRFPQVSDEEVMAALSDQPSGRSSSKRDTSAAWP